MYHEGHYSPTYADNYKDEPVCVNCEDAGCDYCESADEPNDGEWHMVRGKWVDIRAEFPEDDGDHGQYDEY